jgi:hypothetical protein
MIKVMWMLKRKAGITFEQFRDHYESSHAVLGQNYLGHLLLEYRRNYDLAQSSGATQGQRTSGFDCITEWVMRDHASFDECMRLLRDPAIGKLFHDDEEHFLDRESVTLIRSDCRDTGPGSGAETLKLQPQA